MERTDEMEHGLKDWTTGEKEARRDETRRDERATNIVRCRDEQRESAESTTFLANEREISARSRFHLELIVPLIVIPYLREEFGHEIIVPADVDGHIVRHVIVVRLGLKQIDIAR